MNVRNVIWGPLTMLFMIVSLTACSQLPFYQTEYTVPDAEMVQRVLPVRDPSQEYLRSLDRVSLAHTLREMYLQQSNRLEECNVRLDKLAAWRQCQLDRRDGKTSAQCGL